MSPAVEQSLGQVAIGLGDPVRALRAHAAGTERRNACRPRKSFRAAARPAPRTNAGAERARRSAPTWNPLLARLPDTGRWTGSERTRAYSRLFSSASTSLVVRDHARVGLEAALRFDQAHELLGDRDVRALERAADHRAGLALRALAHRADAGVGRLGPQVVADLAQAVVVDEARDADRAEHADLAVGVEALDVAVRVDGHVRELAHAVPVLKVGEHARRAWPNCVTPSNRPGVPKSSVERLRRALAVELHRESTTRTAAKRSSRSSIEAQAGRVPESTVPSLDGIDAVPRAVVLALVGELTVCATAGLVEHFDRGRRRVRAGAGVVTVNACCGQSVLPAARVRSLSVIEMLVAGLVGRERIWPVVGVERRRSRWVKALSMKASRSATVVPSEPAPYTNVASTGVPSVSRPAISITSPARSRSGWSAGRSGRSSRSRPFRALERESPVSRREVAAGEPRRILIVRAAPVLRCRAALRAAGVDAVTPLLVCALIALATSARCTARRRCPVTLTVCGAPPSTTSSNVHVDPTGTVKGRRRSRSSRPSALLQRPRPSAPAQRSFEMFAGKLPANDTASVSAAGTARSCRGRSADRRAEHAEARALVDESAGRVEPERADARVERVDAVGDHEVAAPLSARSNVRPVLASAP
jgi:hypothetical protein